MKLISMTSFVLEQVKLLKTQENNILQFRNNITNYANFLKQPLKLEMFVPCDKNGNVLEEPNDYFPEGIESDYSKKYQKAKEKVLFEGFENYDIKWIERLIENETIESGLELNGTITLTPNAIKQLGL